MKTAYFDCFSGASGNMVIGAFLDAGVPLFELEKELAKLQLTEEYDLLTENVQKQGIRACYFDVRLTGAPCHHRTYPEIFSLIVQSPLLPKVKELALKILERLGRAEARVHGCSLEEVHFHEVGAVDTIVDLVGAAFCLHYLNIEQVYSSFLHTGSGMIDCAHGRLPIPAPATAELLQGAAFYSTDIQGELLTPTGAAIITTLAREYGPLPALKNQTISYGAGTWDLKIPNVLRLFIGNSPDRGVEETATIIETTIDDMNPELYGHLMDSLFKAGAADVYFTPVFMKKNRPGILVTVTSTLPDQKPLLDILFTESTTLGVRLSPHTRHKLDRETRTLDLPYGSVRIKLGLWAGSIKNMAPEYEDCRLLAEKTGKPLKQVYQEALALARQHFSL